MENPVLKFDGGLGLGRMGQGAKSRGSCRGQATVEFILTLVIALLIITAIILPSYDNSSNYVVDVSNLAKLRVSSDKLVDALQYVYVSGRGTKQTIEVVIPQNATISCQQCSGSPLSCIGGAGGISNSIIMTYGLLSKQSIPSCLVDDDPGNGQSCRKIFGAFPAGSTSTFICAPGSAPVSYSQGLYLMTVQKAYTDGVLSIAGTKIG